MGLTDWASDHLLATVAISLASLTLAVVSALGVAGWLLAALLGLGGTGTLGSLLPLFVVGLVVGVPATVVGLVAVAVGIAARASSAVNGTTEIAGIRLGRVASYVERENEYARMVGLADLVENFDTRSAEQRADDRTERLKERYVEGEISEYEFEQRMQTILDEEGVRRDRVSTIDDELRATERN
ncbi:SHOCT domain-containing protein [Halosimplex pelagicum]|uniref:SHOCT domain-containing protein n=1 Tax=Halosimplex pelagicum TaxID=869886 RepID=A0A7D5T4W2_9EURY|nr:SHOCT domain-containing protein [Halosimplex pelagicum]QLH81808.1 SHOCT domain-containing protein [Halosimplex pelagicum]